MVLRAADLFCGAGGSTTGAIQSGNVDVVLAINHWRTAVYSHQDNHPDTKHLCCRIEDIDPRNDKGVPDIDLLMASPECTHFSVARGAAPIKDQKRATPWHVQIWAEAKRPKWIVVENVAEFTNWGPLGKNGKPLKSKKGETFRAWIGALESLGYSVDWRVLNAADYGEATTRKRLFVVGRRGRNRSIPWPVPTHDESEWKPAHKIIDWEIPAPSIWARKRPLAEKTLRRIQVGLERFVEPFLVSYHGGTDSDRRSHALDKPLPTIDTSNRFGVAMPYLVHLRGTGTARDINRPAPTVTAGGGHSALAIPFLHSSKSGGAPRSVDEPIPTVTTKGSAWLSVPYLLDVNHGSGEKSRVHDVKDPMRTITTRRGQAIAIPWIVKYHGTATVDSVENPLSTVTTKHRHGLAIAKTMDRLGVADIGFRMLEPHELAAAQGFPEGYQLHGSKADQVRQIGNSVAPGVMKAICSELN